jgi:hypothetical protein
MEFKKKKKIVQAPSLWISEEYIVFSCMWRGDTVDYGSQKTCPYIVRWWTYGSGSMWLSQSIPSMFRNVVRIAF